MGSQLLPPNRGTAPQFSVHVYCGQTAGWIKTPVGTEVDLGPSHIVLDGDPAPPRKRHSSPPLFGPCLYCGHGRPSQLLLRSCHTAHGTASLYFTMGRPSPSKLSLTIGVWTSHYAISHLGQFPQHHILCINVRPHDFTIPSSSIYSVLSSYIRLPLASPEPVARCSVR